MNGPAAGGATMPLNVFAEDPDTVGFVSRYDNYYVNFLRERPYIRMGKVLSGNYVVSYTNRANMGKLSNEFNSYSIAAVPLVMGLLDRPNLEAAGIAQVQQQPYLSLRGGGVLLGLVDTGIDYTNPVFIYEDGTTKIRYLWDQTISGTPPNSFPVGTEYTAQEINQALRSDNPRSVIPSQDTVGHGTFLASLMGARGRPEEYGAAPDADFVVVKLRGASAYTREYHLVPPAQQNAFEATDAMLGIEYILEKALALNMPVAICFALGSNRGGHDGFTVIEEYMSFVSYRTGVCLCAAAGNESQARHHTQGVIPGTDQSQNINITVSEGAGDIWLSLVNTASDRLSVSVKSPTGEMVRRIPAKNGLIMTTKLVLERSSIQIEYFYPVEGSGGQQTYIKIFDPTPGIWAVTAYGDIILNGTYHCWLPITGFVSPGVEFLTPVPYTTVVVPATALGVITCGAYSSANNALYMDSSWGPTRLPMSSPELVAPGVDVGGIFPGGPGTMTGTSVATAITAGACALMLQWGIVEGNDPYVNTPRIRAFLIRGCERDPNILYPNEQWGYGRLSLQGAFNQMREI